MNILWVENHQRFATMAVENFLAEHQVTVTPSIQEARQTLSGGPFDVVLLDYDLDDGKGTKLVTEILSHPRRPLLIATSSHAVGNQALVKAGADGVCSKMEFTEIGRVMTNLMAARLYKPGISVTDQTGDIGNTL